ncbi:hypothetical protein SlsnVgp037 [Spodoptera littoralis nucleopolyhedrovirus]|uniref:Uncharacterized protein n=1 Tax=Spodoptera littoralis nuclear polyhedrosis virus TaxID=10456 RepID=M1JSF9_NPVSL|nr:hypothetical protein SlsnVgp037 [Spodoptera littoralis nucleopolyhedrovirus]AGE89892.1 hypothetical protein SlsnVgp037 [Spodoptera littoralis nucleopolyhedrovirus]
MPLLFLLIQPPLDIAAAADVAAAAATTLAVPVSRFSKISHKIRCMTVRRRKGVRLKYKSKKRIF